MKGINKLNSIKERMLGTGRQRAFTLPIAYHLPIWLVFFFVLYPCDSLRDPFGVILGVLMIFLLTVPNAVFSARYALKYTHTLGGGIRLSLYNSAVFSLCFSLLFNLSRFIFEPDSFTRLTAALIENPLATLLDHFSLFLISFFCCFVYTCAFAVGKILVGWRKREGGVRLVHTFIGYIIAIVSSALILLIASLFDHRGASREPWIISATLLYSVMPAVCARLVYLEESKNIKRGITLASAFLSIPLSLIMCAALKRTLVYADDFPHIIALLFIIITLSAALFTFSVLLLAGSLAEETKQKASVGATVLKYLSLLALSVLLEVLPAIIFCTVVTKNPTFNAEALSAEIFLLSLGSLSPAILWAALHRGNKKSPLVISVLTVMCIVLASTVIVSANFACAGFLSNHVKSEEFATWYESKTQSEANASFNEHYREPEDIQLYADFSLENPNDVMKLYSPSYRRYADFYFEIDGYEYDGVTTYKFLSFYHTDAPDIPTELLYTSSKGEVAFYGVAAGTPAEELRSLWYDDPESLIFLRIHGEEAGTYEWFILRSNVGAIGRDVIDRIVGIK